AQSYWGMTRGSCGCSPTATNPGDPLPFRHTLHHVTDPQFRPPSNCPMRLLFVHERFGALGGAEANVLLTATELKRRGHTLGLLHGAPTGKEEATWREVFADRRALADDAPAEAVTRALAEFRPDVIFLHKLAQLDAL